MDLTLHTDNVRITDDLEAFVDKKLSKLERYMPNIESVYVELSQQNSHRGPDIVVAQITVRHDRGAILRTEERLDKQDNGTIKNAITSASDKMYRRIRRFKNKPRSKRLRERYAMTQEEFSLAEELPDELFPETESSQDEAEQVVIRRKVVGVIAMHEEEAIQQMELLGHSFFMFFNPETNAVNVIYKRGSGGYGLLEPEVV